MFYLFTCSDTPNSTVENPLHVLQMPVDNLLSQIICLRRKASEACRLVALQERGWTPLV